VSTTMDHASEEALERLRFFPRQLIGADDLNQEQAYHRQRLREHNRFLHGWGVVCGCDVQAAPTADKPWQVRILPGYLLTPHGDSVSIRSEVMFDLATCFLESRDPCAFARPCPPVTHRTLTNGSLYLAVRYAECETRPVRIAPSGCACDEAECAYSRIRDAYELCCLTTLPGTHAPAERDCANLLQSPRIVPCPQRPEHSWVVLATISLPQSHGTAIEQIDPLTHRRALHSTAILQEMVLCLIDKQT
jgi:hypothetical protein